MGQLKCHVGVVQELPMWAINSPSIILYERTKIINVNKSEVEEAFVYYVRQ